MGRKDDQGCHRCTGRGASKKGSRPAKVLYLDQYRWRKAGQALRQKLGEFAADPLFSREAARAQEIYLAGINPYLVNENEEMIMERCFEWFIFDYVMKGGETLIDIYSAITGQPELEERLVREWCSSRMSIFEVCGVYPHKGIRLKDLILGSKFTVINYNVSGELEKGAIVYMRVIRVGEEYEFSTGGLALPPAYGKALIKKVNADIRRYTSRKGRGSFSPELYLRDRAYKINAWMLDVALNYHSSPDREGVAAESNISSLIAQRITDLFLDDYYEKWINQPVQALGDKTPKEMCKTVHGRTKVEQLLKELETVEKTRLKKGQPHYDINKVRARLGLIPGGPVNRAARERIHTVARISEGEENIHWADRAQAGVAMLVREEMKLKNYTPEQISSAIWLWFDYCGKENPTIRKEKIWLAAVIYTLARLEFNNSVQQQKLVAEYGVSPSSLSEKYRSLCRSLDLVVFDRRYTSGSSPIEGLELSDPLLARIFYRLKL